MARAAKHVAQKNRRTKQYFKILHRERAPLLILKAMFLFYVLCGGIRLGVEAISGAGITLCFCFVYIRKNVVCFFVMKPSSLKRLSNIIHFPGLMNY